MARLRLTYDLANKCPFILDHGKSTIPNGYAPTAKVLNIGGGSSYPVLETTSGNVIDARAKFTHTSGDGRLAYMRLALHGSSGGDCMRVYTNVNANLDTARGIHTSLNFVATAGGSECSGLGTPIAATLHIPNIPSWAPTGTLAAMVAEIYSDGGDSDPDGLTSLAFHRIVNAGNATGGEDVDDDANLFRFEGFTAGSGNMFSAAQNMPAGTGVTYGIKCNLEGVGTLYLLAVSSLAT